MSRYIDADAIVKSIREIRAKHLISATFGARDEAIIICTLDGIAQHLDLIPAADVQEVRHGRWIREPNCYYRCSVCGDHHPSIKSNMDYNYCPNCGAKMDEVANENPKHQ